MVISYTTNSKNSSSDKSGTINSFLIEIVLIAFFQDGPEVEISLEEDERRETGSNSDQRPQEDVLDSEEDDEAVLHLQQEEEEELPIHQV